MAANRRYISSNLGKIYDRFGDLGWPAFRIVYGLFYIPHGCRTFFDMFGGNAKGVAQAVESIGFTHGMAWAQFLGGLEIFGGLFLVLGLCTRPIALLFLAFMFLGAFFFHAQFGYFWTNAGMEVPLLMMLLAIALLLRGGGEFSLDRKIGFEF